MNQSFLQENSKHSLFAFNWNLILLWKNLVWLFSIASLQPPLRVDLEEENSSWRVRASAHNKVDERLKKMFLFLNLYLRLFIFIFVSQTNGREVRRICSCPRLVTLLRAYCGCARLQVNLHNNDHNCGWPIGRPGKIVLQADFSLIVWPMESN